MKPKYTVWLTSDEEAELRELTKSGNLSTPKMKRALALLHGNEGTRTDQEIADILFMHRRSIEEIRKRFVEDGFRLCLDGLPKAHKPSIMHGENQARLIKLACEETIDGVNHWSLRFLSRNYVTVEGTQVSHETIRKTLHESELKPWQRREFCIPPSANADFVAAMEDILELYKLPPNPDMPLICMDECPKQLIGEVRPVLSAKPGLVEKYDTEYKRNGTCDLFIFSAPHLEWRRVDVFETRTMVDWANQIKQLVDVDFPDAKLIKLVCDNLNTHRPASLYTAFPPAEARRLLDKLEIHYTPKHGSWLNMAEIELSVLNNHGLKDRIPTMEQMRLKTEAWAKMRNETVKRIDWQFTTEDARVKLTRLYPQLSA
jgi:transposase